MMCLLDHGRKGTLTAILERAHCADVGAADEVESILKGLRKACQVNIALQTMTFCYHYMVPTPQSQGHYDGSTGFGVSRSDHGHVTLSFSARHFSGGIQALQLAGKDLQRGQSQRSTKCLQEVGT